MRSAAKRSTPQQFVAEAEAVFQEFSLQVAHLRSQARAILEGHREPKGATVMREGKAPFSRELDAWDELTIFATDESLIDSFAVDSQETLDGLWQWDQDRIAANKAHGLALAMDKRIERIVLRLARELWRPITAAAKAARKRSQHCLDFDPNPWRTFRVALEAAQGKNPGTLDRLAELFAEERAALPAGAEDRWPENSDTFCAARSRICYKLFMAQALIEVGVTSQPQVAA
jgi:hypothetical protein